MDARASDLLHSLLSNRRSQRDFSDQGLALAQLNSILLAGQGHTSPDGKRGAPSAHALHPLRLRVIARRVEGLAPGVHDFDSASATLHQVGPALSPGSLNAAALGDETWLEQAAAVVVIIADRELAIRHFAEQQADGLRGARYVDFEAGAVTQNMYLAVTAVGLGAVVVMGFDDLSMNATLGVTGSEAAVALFCVGQPRR